MRHLASRLSQQPVWWRESPGLLSVSSAPHYPISKPQSDDSDGWLPAEAWRDSLRSLSVYVCICVAGGYIKQIYWVRYRIRSSLQKARKENTDTEQSNKWNEIKFNSNLSIKHHWGFPNLQWCQDREKTIHRSIYKVNNIQGIIQFIQTGIFWKRSNQWKE